MRLRINARKTDKQAEACTEALYRILSNKSKELYLKFQAFFAVQNEFRVHAIILRVLEFLRAKIETCCSSKCHPMRRTQAKHMNVLLILKYYLAILKL